MTTTDNIANRQYSSYFRYKCLNLNTEVFVEVIGNVNIINIITSMISLT